MADLIMLRLVEIFLGFGCSIGFYHVYLQRRQSNAAFILSIGYLVASASGLLVLVFPDLLISLAPYVRIPFHFKTLKAPELRSTADIALSTATNALLFAAAYLLSRFPRRNLRPDVWIGILVPILIAIIEVPNAAVLFAFEVLDSVASASAVVAVGLCVARLACRLKGRDVLSDIVAALFLFSGFWQLCYWLFEYYLFKGEDGVIFVYSLIASTVTNAAGGTCAVLLFLILPPREMPDLPETSIAL